MMEMKKFQQKLVELLDKAESQEKNLKNEEVLETFGMNQLSADQLQSLYEYLRIQGIRIEGMELKRMDISADFQPENEKEEDEKEIQLVPLEMEDEECLKEYRSYLEIIPTEKEGEREQLLASYGAGDGSATERLAQLYLPYLLDTARKMYRKGIYIGDLIQEGNMSLLTAPVEEMPKSQADSWMKDIICKGMENWLEEQTEQKLRDDSMVEKVRKLEAAIRELSDDDDQKFTIEELSAYLDMDEEEIRAVLSLTGEGNEDGQEQ